MGASAGHRDTGTPEHQAELRSTRFAQNSIGRSRVRNVEPRKDSWPCGPKTITKNDGRLPPLRLPRPLDAAPLMPLTVHAKAPLLQNCVPDLLLQPECLATGGSEHFARPSRHNNAAVSSEQSKRKKSVSQIGQSAEWHLGGQAGNAEVTVHSCSKFTLGETTVSLAPVFRKD